MLNENSTKKKKLAIVTGSEETKNTLCNQMKYYLEDCVDIEGFSEEIQVTQPIEADLVVMSSKIVADEMKEYVRPECSVMIAYRSLDIENLEKLFGIPKGTKAYFVNDIKENTLGCITALKEIGIDYIDFIPYYPGCRVYQNAEIAVTVGEEALVPNHVEKIIDIGARIIDVSSIVEILKHFDLMDKKLDLVSVKYKEGMVRLSNNLYHLFNEASQMNQYFAKILNQINDGIIAFYGNGIISIFNEKCKTIFGDHAEGELIDTVVSDKSLRDYLISRQDLSDKLVRIDNSDFIINKFHIEKTDTIVCTIKNTKENKDIEVKLRQSLIKKGYVGKYRFNDIVATSPIMQDTVHIAKKLARTDLNILIYGESGVGKEIFASAIHNESKWSKGPFVAINFSAISEDLVESELFGYEEGAFTGAKKGGRLGIFEQANQGTIFLDEIGDISPRIQTRLLRVLQEKEIRRVGGSENIPINVRVIAATNKNLLNMCREGTFREDLYHRIKKFYLKIPPLNTRTEDIDILVRHFLKKHGGEKLIISEEVMELLHKNHWNGNVRELENVIEYIIAVCDEQMVTILDLPEDLFDEPVRRVNEFESYHHILCEKGNLEEYVFLLKMIRSRTDEGLTSSRKTLAEAAKKVYPYTTEDRIRKKTDDLQDLKLITKSVGRVGMRLTINGVKYLNNINQFPPI